MAAAGPINLDSPPAPDEAFIRTMFDRMAGRYDAFSWLTGFGQTHRWRARTVATLRPGMRVLDLGCGTGDLAIAAARRVGAAGEVVGLDFSGEMLAVAERKARRHRLPAGLRWVRRSAQDLPLPGEAFDAVVSGFVLRNLYEHAAVILAGVFRSLRPGGQVRFLDLTEPRHPLLRRVFRAYLYGPAGIYGAALFGRDYPIPYLPDSARRFWKTDEFSRALAAAGFTGIEAQPLMFGGVTLYSAVRPGRFPLE